MVGEPTSVLRAVRIAVLAAIVLFSPGTSAFAQASPPPTAPSSVLPTGGGQALLDPSDTVILLLDHQSGLLNTVKDVSLPELRANVVLLGRLAELMKIPVITTASEPNGTK